MASMNALSRELVFKIVYYGPGLGGKTTTLEHLHASTKAEHRGKLVSLATPVDRTLYFDFLPVRLPPMRGMSVRLQLFTVPGQVYFNATRKLVLTGADGIVFVSDSQAARADANVESLENLRENLAEQGRSLEKIPLIFQHNKRDLPDLLPIEELDGILNPLGVPSVPTSARSGVGVYEGLEKITELVLRSFSAKLPDQPELDLASGFSAVEGGLTGGLMSALRDASAPVDPSDVVVARITEPAHADALAIPADTADADSMRGPVEASGAPEAPAEDPALPAEGPVDAAPSPPRAEMPAPAAIATTEVAFPEAPAPAVTTEVAFPETTALVATTEVAFSEAPAVAAPEVALPLPAPVPRSAAPPRNFSFAELWADAEQETVRDVEAAIASQRYARAVELCEALVARVLASAAGLFGTSEAPRDPALIGVLLGLNGARYLAFRAIVREARAGAALTSRDALIAYAFAIDARLTRSSIR